jgi:hypothetical protein
MAASGVVGSGIKPSMPIEAGRAPLDYTQTNSEEFSINLFKLAQVLFAL